ncbi:hypothetical protein [Cytobacillus purgationiresistens]|uniref:Uncharacterized protein n=1 Tax=Cytobacillus purgationiresistens TaxID=863449 RepID=A0ABU0AFG0_9BACI|nr:hypothetical protein [Cytobacillus purgationiresistens]MDQ0269760.1 hypothetical protein [Cytobacillus purgationiresistens]
MKKKIVLLLFVFSVFAVSSVSAAPDREPICIKVPGGQDICEW